MWRPGPVTRLTCEGRVFRAPPHLQTAFLRTEHCTTLHFRRQGCWPWRYSHSPLYLREQMPTWCDDCHSHDCRHFHPSDFLRVPSSTFCPLSYPFFCWTPSKVFSIESKLFHLPSQNHRSLTVAGRFWHCLPTVTRQLQFPLHPGLSAPTSSTSSPFPLTSTLPLGLGPSVHCSGAPLPLGGHLAYSLASFRTFCLFLRRDPHDRPV